MQKEINIYQEMASEHRLQEYSKGTVPLYFLTLKFTLWLLNHTIRHFNNVLASRNLIQMRPMAKCFLSSEFEKNTYGNRSNNNGITKKDY